MKIALDVMGGDLAPLSNLEGAFSYMEQVKNSNLEILLVGDENTIKNAIAQYPEHKQRIKIIPTTQIIEMDEKPSRIFRTKPDSSLVRCIELMKNGDADATISAGNTGALLTSSLFMLGKIKGIHRPALGPYIPTEKGGFILCDAGANADVKPQHLLQFALMASAYLEVQENVKAPKVGLINIGLEAGKGNELTRSSYPLLKKYMKNFVGNIESRYLLNGKIDVAVCDGFTGNIILKLTEGIFNNITQSLNKGMNQNSSDLKSISLDIKNKYDFEEYGGTPLLGINGIVMKCHGASSKKSIMNTIKSIKHFHDADLINKISKKMSKHSEIFEDNFTINETQTA